jgi:hypothetical protein
MICEFHPYDEPAYDIYEAVVRAKNTGNNTRNNAVMVKLKKKIAVKNVLGKINGVIDMSVIPAKIKNVKVAHAIVDCSENEFYGTGGAKNTLYIKRNKNITNIEIL